MRVIKKFITLDMQIAESTIQREFIFQSKENSGLFASKRSGRHALSSFKMKDVAMSGSDASGQQILRPEKNNGLNIVQIDARVNDESASIGSVPESQTGILRQFDFDVHSESNSRGPSRDI